MHIEYWKSFVETAQQKSISKASEKLQITHPALSKQIQSLERYYGVSLFHRFPMGVELTDAGQLLFEKLQHLLQEHEMIRAELQQYSSTKQITLGTLPSIAAIYLPSKVIELQKNGFKVKIEVHYTTMELIDRIHKKAIDAALIEQTPLHKSVWEVELFRESYYAILSIDHHLSDRSELSMVELANEPLVVHPPQCNIRKKILQEFRLLELTPRIGMEIHFGESILAYVATGMGIAIIPLASADQVTDPKLKVIPVCDFNAERVITLVARSASVGNQLLRYLK